MVVSAKLRAIAQNLVVAMAVTRPEYRKKIEQDILPVLEHYYNTVLCEKMKSTPPIESSRTCWWKQMEVLLLKVKQNIARQVTGGATRYHLYEKAKQNTIKDEDKRIRRDAKRNIIKAFGSRHIDITDEDMTAFWENVMDPIARMILRNQGEDI